METTMKRGPTITVLSAHPSHSMSTTGCCPPRIRLLLQVLGTALLIVIGVLVSENQTLRQGGSSSNSPNKKYDTHYSKLPYCQSGNDYVSLELGGQWVDTHTLFEGYDPNDLCDSYHGWFLCYQQTGYSDTFQWKPPCRPYPSPFLDSIATSAATTNLTTIMTTTTAPTGITTSTTPRKKGVRVFLWGDSLTNQIYVSQKLQRRIPATASSLAKGIEYFRIDHREPYLVPSVLPFPAQRSPFCHTMINENPPHFYLQNFSSEADLLEFVFANETYDYVFFNEFAHFGYVTDYLWNNCYKDANHTVSDMMKDAMDYYQQQMERLAFLLLQYHGYTQVYYRTTSPHVYQWKPASKPLEQVPTPLTYADCVDIESLSQNTHVWKCAYAMNDMAAKAFTKYGHKVLDSGPTMSLRVDAHPCSNSGMLPTDPNYNQSRGDCNHFCTPGPPDVMLAAIEAEVLARETEKLHKKNNIP